MIASATATAAAEPATPQPVSPKRSRVSDRRATGRREPSRGRHCHRQADAHPAAAPAATVG